LAVGGNGGAMTSSTGKPFAVVTGASSGIGGERARQFATHDYNASKSFVQSFDRKMAEPGSARR
jgi:hypothetical protein